MTHRVASLLLGLISACSPRQAVERVLVGGHFDLTRNIAYGNGERQRLDVYRPRNGRQSGPVVVFLYGGRWQAGSKDEYRLVGDAFTQRGLIAVVPDYRLYPEERFPAWVEDAARVIGWVRANIHRFGGDSARVFVVGHSAGAHTAVLLVLDEQYLRSARVPHGFVRGVAALAGPVATVWTDPDVQALMGPRESWAATYPINHISGGEPPLLLLHGAKDRTVAPTNSTRLADRVRREGGCAKAIVYRGLSHVGIVVALALPRFGIAPVLADVLAFVENPVETACRGE